MKTWKHILVGVAISSLLWLAACQPSGKTEKTIPENQTTHRSEAPPSPKKKVETEAKNEIKKNYKVKLLTMEPSLEAKEVKVSFDMQPNDGVVVAITDVGHVAIHSDTLQTNAQAHTLKLDKLRPGIYLVSVIAPSGQRASKELFWQ
ncbi:hypothetical protein [Microscilla marina]|uniref:Lipoprotein, putative n=1 Tax=Microscilla marina ATCC 23134 TaxID=313606 RepID=A1ZNQ8_MICM2|nr:hypothetical protein [Microscilla marina]EAY27947.1 lipoprotein, putative [Microscilla marina ATCC 23134]